MLLKSDYQGFVRFIFNMELVIKGTKKFMNEVSIFTLKIKEITTKNITYI